MDRSFLVAAFGFPATLVHGDSLVLDRWFWLKRRLPITLGGKKLLDVGCGTGAFSIGAGKRGYEVLGLSWDERNQKVGAERARLCNVSKIGFDVCDIRYLDQRSDLTGQYDYVICLETIEHIVDDFKLMRDIANCLRPGGRLLLTTPWYHFRAISFSDNGGADLQEEDGGHVRRGYSTGMLTELCETAGLVCEETSYCTGFLSQRLTTLMRQGNRIHPLFGWTLALPLRPIVLLLDKWVTRLIDWPYYSICIEAYKPRIGPDVTSVPPEKLC